MRNKKNLVILIVIAVVSTLLFYKLTSHVPEQVTATGTVEITKVEITPRLSGYIKNLTIDTGYRVTSGEKLFNIERKDLGEQLNADRYASLQAQAKLEDLQRGARDPEIAASIAILKTNQAILETATVDLHRYKLLYDQLAISKQQLDLMQKNYEVAFNSVNNAQAQLNLLQAGNREDQIVAQQAEVSRLEALSALNKSVFHDTTLISNINGIVISRNFENNEYVSAGAPVLTIADMQDCWIKIYIASNDLGKISFGQKAIVKIDSFPNEEFHAHVKEIADKAEFTPRQSITKNERTNMVFAVKVKVDNSSEKLKPGMPADVVFQ